MLEVALIIGAEGQVLHRHQPLGASSVHLPDSRTLWERIWADRAQLAGLAHSHPGSGEPTPSREDLTTFAACEAGLGRRLDWWIATSDQLARYRWAGPGIHEYQAQDPVGPAPWLPELLELSNRADLDEALPTPIEGVCHA